MTSINPDANLIKELEKLSKQDLIKIIEESKEIIKNTKRKDKKKLIEENKNISIIRKFFLLHIK
jgi:phosphoribosyl-ATP pyrophosphohydrolase